MSTQIDTTAFKERLEARKAELDKRLHQIEHDLDEPASHDIVDRATEREDDEVMEAMGNAGLGEIEAINAALSRIDAGTFGLCVACDEDISPERLSIMPTAVKCRNCM